MEDPIVLKSREPVLVGLRKIEFEKKMLTFKVFKLSSIVKDATEESYSMCNFGHLLYRVTFVTGPAPKISKVLACR